jgi:ABC-2 type transport system ATP-binding protein
LHVQEGEVFGLLGPNGAGKTTIIRMLNTLMTPSSGSAAVGSHDVIKKCLDVKKLIGVVPQELNLDRDITGRQNLRIQGLLRKVPDLDNSIISALSWAGIEDRADDVVKKYSGGMQRRLLIARAVMHNPSVLFLDEPTVGLDPQIRRTIWDLIKQLNKKGITILITTHYIEEAERLCHRVGILAKGKLIACDTPDALKTGCGHFAVETVHDGVTDFRMFPTRQDANLFAETMNGEILIRQSSLEDVFIHLTGRKIGA